jgi:hypothetical protein
MNDIPKDELRNFVRQFLEEFKSLVLENGLYVIDRLINRDALLELGLTDKQRSEIILSISVMEFNSGPIKDQYKSGVYWVFGKKIDSVEVYIKLKIIEYSGKEHAVCLSFHKSDHPLKYPFAD